MDKAEKIKKFDADGLASNDALFGLPFNFDESEIIILPVPWEVTVSYRAGTANSVKGILNASYQVDLYDSDYPDSWKAGFFMLEPSVEMLRNSNLLRPKAFELIKFQEKGGDVDSHPQFSNILKEINAASEEMNNWVFEQTNKLLNNGKKVALLGGDHSTPLGFIKALSTKHEKFGVLQFDAHADLRPAYEGFTHSHASIFYNALKIENLEKLVQFGIRDLSSGEADIIRSNPDRIKCFYDRDVKRDLFAGKKYEEIVDEVVEALPQKVYISFDIDALDPKLCPNTGTPVPGGYGLDEAFYIIQKVKASGREIIGFDLSEVASEKHEWDCIVGARTLFRLCNALA
ncbi:MAG: agmatinase [Chitinophagaceae bacterium]|nr:MAG: agmatinase [Chitinophagaceae bacterium]